MNESNIYQHFQPEERPFIERCLDFIDQVENHYSVVTTSFLNPRELQILRTLTQHRELQFFSSQDLALTELSKVILAPNFYHLDLADFDLVLLEIHFSAKFDQLSHAQILGTFLGQTGVKRQEIGDIIVSDERAQIFVSQHLVEIFKSIKKIGRTTVRITETALTELSKAKETAASEVILTESLRIDKIIAVSLKISRNVATNMLKSNKVKVNYLGVNEKDFSVDEGDLISIRGFGRIEIGKNLGPTKKGKFRIEIEVTRNRKN